MILGRKPIELRLCGGLVVTKAGNGRRLSTMLRVHCMQHWYNMSDPAMKECTKINTLKRQAEKEKASIRAKVEHPFRVIKCQFGFTKARYRGMKKNGSQLHSR